MNAKALGSAMRWTWRDEDVEDGVGGMPRLLLWAALLAAGAGAILGIGVALALAHGDPVIRRALPQAGEAELPRIFTSRRTGAQAPLVVLDPGHGGFDPGASNESGLREKDVALALALAVRDRLLALGGVRVAMTREDDRFLPLQARPALAEGLNADAFVSIHADIASSETASGANAYVLAARASDAEAQALARIQNQSANTLPETARADDVTAILADLMRREAALDSAALAGAVEGQAQGTIPVHAPFRRGGNFVVLRSPEMPSILFEAGYLSSPADTARLSTEAGRDEVARVLADAILAHLLAPPAR